MDRPLRMGKRVKIFVSHVNAHQRLTSAEKDFNNQDGRVIHSVDISQPLFWATSGSHQWAYEQKGHSGVYTHALEWIPFTTYFSHQFQANLNKTSNL